MRKILSLWFCCLLPGVVWAEPKINIAFQWHMHQPIYWPYESVVQTAQAGRWGFNVIQIHTDRTGPYTAWPIDAIQAGMSFEHLGAQVSFTGSLMENLSALEAAGIAFSGWKNRWRESASWRTSLGNPRLDLVAISYHHPLLALIPALDRRLQIQAHRRALERNFAVAASRGIFPPETAFAEHIIPELVAEGLQWVIVDNIHFDRARPDYPYTSASNLIPPNPAEQQNTAGQATWVQLVNLWAPSKVSVPWGYQPHWVAYTDPQSGQKMKIIAVPAARYEGNEDARGGFGALLYEQVFSQYEQHNTDSAHPMLVLLHHDGDNYGGGTESYYHGNFSNFLSWLGANSGRFECTTISDYLARFPPAENDIIHVEPGSWSGADNGDPEFAKWNGKPGADGYSPDRHSWAVITAAANRVHHAEAIQAHSSIDAIIDGSGSSTDRAWHFLLNAETSCYWYWDGAEDGKWDSHPSRAANLAVAEADRVIGNGSNDTTPPTIWLPQRTPYNPGGMEWAPQPADFTVWTFVYDVNGLAEVSLYIRVDSDGQVDEANRLYAGGQWQILQMQASELESRTDPVPIYKAQLYQAQVTGVRDALVDYYVYARDGRGLESRSPIQHVYVGQGGGSSSSVGWSPQPVRRSDRVLVWAGKAGKLHWGVNSWKLPARELWPAGTVEFGDGKSVETPLAGPDSQGRFSVQLGPFTGTDVTIIDFVIHHDDGTWDNNQGADYHIPILDDLPDGGVDGGADAGFDADGGQQIDADGDIDAGADAAQDSGTIADGEESPGEQISDGEADGAASNEQRPEDLADGGEEISPARAPGCGCNAAETPSALLPALGLLLLLLGYYIRKP